MFVYLVLILLTAGASGCSQDGPMEEAGETVDEAIEDTRYLDFLFRQKSVPAWIDYWGHDVNHDWPWWYRQMNYFLGRLYG